MLSLNFEREFSSRLRRSTFADDDRRFGRLSLVFWVVIFSLTLKDRSRNDSMFSLSTEDCRISYVLTILFTYVGDSVPSSLLVTKSTLSTFFFVSIILSLLSSLDCSHFFCVSYICKHGTE